MLAYHWFGQQGMPVVFLHGLLGSQHDWAPIVTRLQKTTTIRSLVIDLPGHGESVQCIENREAMREALHQTLQQQLGNQSFYLVGYSLGGRICLDYIKNISNKHLRGVILEGSHVGLTSETERQARAKQDYYWAERFTNQPLNWVLNDWYQQPVFADLSADKRSAFIQKRQHNNGNAVASLLLATSLATQPRYLPPYSVPYLWLIGEHDVKFRQLADTHHLSYRLISAAGHNTHQANPDGFTQALLDFIGESHGFTSLP